MIKNVAAVFCIMLLAGACAVTNPAFNIPLVSCSSTVFVGGDLFGFQQVAFRSGDLRIGALLTKPPGHGPFPAYIHNHGSGVSRGSLWVMPQGLDITLAQAGYVVLRPARRGYLVSDGSTTTHTATNSPLRARDVIAGAYDEANDVVAAFKYLSECPFVDAQRIVVGGHSLGGFVSIIAAAKLPSARAVISINGGINWVEGGVQTGYSAALDAWYWEAGKIKAPVLVLSGKYDTLIRPDMGRQLVEILQKNKVPAEFLLFEGGHNQIPSGEILSFLDKHLRH